MNPTRIDLVVLDLAGTTVEDAGQVPDAFAAALASYGVHVTAADITRVRGASKREAIRELLGARGEGPELCDEVYVAFKDDLFRRYADTARVANVGDTVLDLRAAHRAGVAYNIGVLSGAHTHAALEAEPHTHLIESVSHLPAVLQ